MEAAVATGAGPAGLTAAEPPGLGGAAEAASAPERLAAAFLSLPGPFQEEDEDDRHKCGRCQAEFTSLEDFVQHKLQKLCQRQQNIAAAAAAAATSTTPVIPSVEEPITIAHVVVEASPVVEEISSAPVVVDSEQFKEIIVTGDHIFENPNGHLDCDDEREQGSPGDPEEEEASVELIKVNLLVNKEGRYVCELCHKTFKTGSILKAHMITHSSKKDYECKLCGTSFRTKGSLIRHHRRHTDERPYECKYCGKSFRESGALTRHLKSLTPCTEKIRFNMNKEIVVNKEDLGTETNGCGTEIVPSLAAHPVEASPVIHLVTDAKGNVLHEVHVQMQELPISEAKSLSQEPSNPEELLPAVEENESLLREAMRNSGIVIEQVSVGEGAKSDEADVAAVLAEELKSEVVETVGKLQEEEQYVKIEQVEMADAEVTNQSEHVCNYCGEIFPELNSLELHINRHLGQQLQAPFTIVHPLDTVMAMSKKRKNDTECRIFDEQWTHDYFFTQCKGRAICLLCQESVSVFEEYSLRLHYDAWHKDTYDSLVGQAREDKISMLKQGLSTQETVFAKRKQLNISSLRTSYQVAKLIACAGRPFIEGEFVKECLLSVAKEMYPEKTDLFSRVSLSKSTLTRRIEEMGDNLQQHLQNASRKLCYFSLALDESNDVCDSAHLLIFVRGTNADFEVTEELAALQSIKGTTTGESVYEKVRQIVNDLELDWAKLAGVTTDGAPSMVGCVKGVVARINQEMDKQNRSHPMAIHCLIHPQALCCKSLTWDSVMDVVVSSVNFIRAHAANHKQLQEFLSELNAIYEDSLFPTEVRWVSHGKVLRRFYDLLPEVSAFLQSKNKEEPELEDAEWKWHLAFLTDITEVLNSFTMQLQGKDKLICDMFSHVEAFEVRLDLLIRQVKEENFRHLPMTEKLSAEKPTVPFPNKKCVDSLEMLQREFQIRFKELHLHEQDIQFFQNPFSVDIEIVDPSYQMELAELQSCDSLKDSFKSNRLINFYASLPSDTYPNLRNHALKMIAFFGSTYVCEQTFSRMKHLKSPLRSRLTDAHLHRLLRLEVTNMEPDIDYLISQKQAQTSH